MPHTWGRLSSVFLRCALGLGFCPPWLTGSVCAERSSTESQ